MFYNPTPPVVKNIILINVIVFLAVNIIPATLGFPLDEYLALYYWRSEHFKPYQMVTHFFTHTFFFHLFFNMLAVWMFGRVLESVWGGKEFLTYYFVTAIGGAIIYALYQTWIYLGMLDDIIAFQQTPSLEIVESFIDKYVSFNDLNPDYAASVQQRLVEWASSPSTFSQQYELSDFMESYYRIRINTPMIGASGAVFGILLAFGWLFPNTELMLLFPPIPIKAKYFVLIYGAIELYAGINYNPSDNIAHFAHIGGMLCGGIYLFIRKKINGTLY